MKLSTDASGPAGGADARPEASAAPGAEASSKTLNFPVVGIGASAGGLAALESFFSGLPRDGDLGLAFVIVQHLAPDHKSLLAELIGRLTPMKVAEVTDGARVEADHIYIIPPNRELALDGEFLRLSQPESPRGFRLPIDHFFRTLAEQLRERAIGVILSGTGSDGTLGVRAVKGAGGMVMAQVPESTEHDGMPRSAIATGMVDYVLTPSKMPGQLLAYVRHAFKAEPVAVEGDALVRDVAKLLRAQTGHDFSQYKSSTLVRRIERRMALRQMETPADYLRYAREAPDEIRALFHDLLIGVTNFFRDPDAFKLLEEQVIAKLITTRVAGEPIRVWTAGCSTGEEAYSVAIAFQERIEAVRRPVKVQIFATDLDPRAIEAARAGIFPGSIAADVSAQRLARYFAYDADRDVYRVHKNVRDLLVFSEQDLIRDPPFSKLDLITCRNLLIYLNVEAQRKLIPLFHYALNPGGYLFLGTSETIGDFTGLFAPLDRKWKIYTRESTDVRFDRSGFPGISAPFSGLRPSEKRSAVGESSKGIPTLRQLTEQALIAHYAEAALLVNAKGDILHIVGRTGRYLEPSSGEPVLNILFMARDGLRREMSTALHKVVAQRQPVQLRGLKVRSDGGITTTDLAIRPVAAPDGMGLNELYLVVLQEDTNPETAADPALAPSGDVSEQIARLEKELRTKEENLQITLEEMESTNEELKSTNEEMQSVNEELQSTNEELETSKEELQSVNEELSTVNAELLDKVADLSRLNNDMNNLLAGTGLGTVFVDHQLRISRFTPAATQVINLIPTDIGRPVEHISPNLVGYHSLADDLAEVLRTLQPREMEVRTKGGDWYLMRIHPYRTMANVIEGAVLTFIDITERKQVQDTLAATQQRFVSILNGVHFGLAQLDLSGRFLFVNDHQCRITGYDRDQLVQMRLQELLDSEQANRLVHGIEAVRKGAAEFEFRYRLRTRSGGEQWFTSRLSPITGPDGTITSVALGSMLDLSPPSGPT